MVKIHGKATLDDVEDAIFESTIYRPALVVANKTDRAEATKNLNELIAFTGNKYTVLAVSCKNPFGLEKLGAELFRALDIMRIYTKEPAKKEPSPKPFILTKGSTAADLARLIHTDFYRSFSYARVWGKRLRFSPQKVGASFVLEDKDIVELHAK
jgi:ribosome-interacting GTPase 1